MSARLTRIVRARSHHEQVEDARDHLAKVRADVDNIRRLVSERKVGASALHTAEYALQAALRRLDMLGWREPPDVPPAA